MGILNTIFGKEKVSSIEKTKSIWTPLQSQEQLDELVILSSKEPVAIFKHSTRCGISRMVLRKFENNVSEELKDFKLFYLDLLNHRDISNEIAVKFAVQHQSPQLLVIKNGIAIAHASHNDIIAMDLKDFKI